jgi:hypothetical protein
MRSSEGCFARQSMYSSNSEPLTRPDSPTFIGLPGSVRNVLSAWSRIADWSDSGIPRSMPMTRIGISAPRSLTKSNRSVPTSGSRHETQYARTWSSSAFIRRGVKTRDISPRCVVWTGGSSQRITPLGTSMFALTISRMSPREDDIVRQSTSACSTSAWRDSAHTS